MAAGIVCTNEMTAWLYMNHLLLSFGGINGDLFLTWVILQALNLIRILPSLHLFADHSSVIKQWCLCLLLLGVSFLHIHFGWVDMASRVLDRIF